MCDEADFSNSSSLKVPGVNLHDQPPANAEDVHSTPTDDGSGLLQPRSTSLEIQNLTAFNTSSFLRSRNVSLTHRKTHSSLHPFNFVVDHDEIQQLVDRFLLKLASRLELLHSSTPLDIDSGFKSAYETLSAVHESCAKAVGDSCSRARILVETVEARHHHLFALGYNNSSFKHKIHSGIALLERVLADLEHRTHSLRNSSHIRSTTAAFLVAKAKSASSTAAAYSSSSYSAITNNTNLDQAWQSLDSSFEKARQAKDNLQENIGACVERALALAQERGLITYTDLPVPWRVNPHIVSGYRFHEGVIDCLRSVLSVNNEMFNIWSHLLGIGLVLFLAFYFYSNTYSFELSRTADMVIAAVFFGAACKCLACSAIWHTFSSLSHQQLMEKFACVDYTGISFLVAASILTTEYTAFYCQSVARWVYMTFTACLGMFGLILPWHPVFNQVELSWMRVLFYVGLSATGLVPVLHVTITRGIPWAFNFYVPILRSLLVYLVGAVLYASKIPERWKPGLFDYVGGSHNIWHLAVLGGIYYHYHAMIGFFTKAHEHAGEACMAR